ncbi:hypothetical protein HY621_02255 [Candidatus Uhrbacteria bacterium]|nr:hypothetical protein [Candidatus Uhrbacteria bacterium]
MEFKLAAGYRGGGIGHRRIFFIGALIAVAAVFFFLYSFLSLESIKDPSIRLNSPDETANYFFSRLYATTGTLGYSEPLLAATEHFLHPRSMTGVHGKVVPVSFVGMPLLYGSVGSILGTKAILFVTPLIAILIPFLFYLFLRAIFSFRVAAISALLLAIHPAYWYFANRAMMHNIIFFGLLVAGFALLASIRTSREYGVRSRLVEALLFFFAGAAIGTSMMVRFSEIVWVAPLMVLVAFVFMRRLSLGMCLVFLLGFSIPITGIFSLNTQLYGSPTSFGYHGYESFDAAGAVNSLQAAASEFFTDPFRAIDSVLMHINAAYQPLAKYILPFGYEPDVFTSNFYQYFGSLFWWFVIPLAIGLLVLLRKGVYEMIRFRRLHILAYVFIGSLVCFWLAAYYGSWVVQDNITNIPTIGNSYIRYWLPLFALSLPGVAMFLVFLFDRAWWGGVQRVAVVGLSALLVLFSFQVVVVDSNESLIAVRDSIRAAREKLYKVLAATEPNAVIVSQRSDKIFFPERRVLESIKDFGEAPLIRPIIESGVPVYYYGLWSDADAAYMSRRYFTPYAFHIEHVADIADAERLFAVKKN